MKRRTAREKALQALFQIDISDIDKEIAIEHVLEGEKSDSYLTKLVDGVLSHQVSIDETIKQYLENWSLERIANVDRNILRLAAYEMMYGQADDVPVNVAIDEAVEIAKLYGDDQSGRFVNGVLSKIKENQQ
ncbi:transcription antitermination factor NusB [Cytobacillus oceanisediminis]|jgi:N utilization substance protein B|uniref:Transcription antitermination protein NusB n=2 Tax=Niallia TaxID=2837506 RepID=A0A941JHK3_NIACI|nr:MULTISPECIES: transcription antitermination factor NusB [Bacillaceae]EOR23345.1 transcription antitermination protein NusB [Niallia nealsonii AAU1]MBQ6447410.1 transcription antitermination factor NusB [Bacillus sp. (in: firmicutes)]MDU1845239.1 transcription antitermination factor NusB [Niallia nealsonii]MBZ9533486.1 transcription antitermination factor NusB [Cytobacillus oceanisediminis]MCB5235874.1 transcription antitermination factor NusB [Niallia circulans]